MLQKITDTELWDGVRASDEKAFYNLYHLYYDELACYGLKRTSDFETTKDLINQLFCSFWTNRLTLPAVDQVKAYIFTCYKNALFHFTKKKKRLQLVSTAYFPAHLASASSIQETIIELQEYQQLQQKVTIILSQLTPRQQQLIRLRFLDELSYEEIAEQHNVSVRTVYNSIHESMKILKKQSLASLLPAALFALLLLFF